jgi:hypothetical protein
MLSKLLHIVALTACLTPAWSKSSSELSFIRRPSTVSIVGPGTVLSVHLIDLPFIKPHYAVKLKTDGGELIEVWTPGKDVLVLEGMHGILTYSTQPEKILSFRVVEQTSKSSQSSEQVVPAPVR